ncbi:MAG: Spo0E family sporulation regulatory protein-aspartic acid phosphatase [Firmicutes bacterium]|nr:Spo0E family sporulation regulatory protein-aspartic acid phosphatase [Bacillota bacterium]
MTLLEKIDLLRDKLNKSISDNNSYEKIYNLSIDLDKLITLYYQSLDCEEIKSI